jgi:carboxymethylenebutenolidase
MGDSLDFLLQDKRVDPSKIAAMGVCQSGAYPLLLNSVRPEIAANVVVYGGATARDWQVTELRPEPYADILARITAPVLGIWGEADFLISVDDVRKLRDTLEAKGKSYEFLLFSDMPHGWLNDTMPGRYRHAEAEAAWGVIVDFLVRVFRGELPRDRVTARFESNISAAYDFSKNVRLA